MLRQLLLQLPAALLTVALKLRRAQHLTMLTSAPASSIRHVRRCCCCCHRWDCRLLPHCSALHLQLHLSQRHPVKHLHPDPLLLPLPLLLLHLVLLLALDAGHELEQECPAKLAEAVTAHRDCPQT
jgi:hypothetical protein